MTCSKNIFLIIKSRKMRPARHMDVCGRTEMEAGFCFGNQKEKRISGSYRLKWEIALE